MSISFVLVLVLILGFLVSRIVENLGLARPGRSGVEYLALGVLLGPRVSNFITETTVATLTPFLSVVLGVVGFRMGLVLRMPGLPGDSPENGQSPRRYAIPGIVAGLFVGAAVTGLTLIAVDLLALDIDRPQWFAIELGAIAMTANETSVRAIASRLGARGPVSSLIASMATSTNVMALLAFGAALSVARASSGAGPSGVEWFLVSVGIGLGQGLLYHLFVSKNEGEGSQFLAVVGVLVFGSGVAYALELSPLFVTILGGLVVGAVLDPADQLGRVIERLEMPLEIVLLFSAGVLLEPLEGLGWALVLAFPIARLAAFGLGGAIGVRVVRKLPKIRGSGNALMGLGILTVAMAVNFALVNREAASLVTNAVIFGLLLTDVLAVPALRQVLADAGELHTWHAPGDTIPPSDTIPPGDTPPQTSPSRRE